MNFRPTETQKTGINETVTAIRKLDPKFDRIKLAIITRANPEYLAERGLRVNKGQQKDLRSNGLSQCCDCLIVKPVNDFHKMRNSINHSCKVCKSERASKYYEENRDQVAERRRKYYEENKDQILEYMRKYQKANRDQRLEYKRKYYEANRDQVLDYLRKYQKTPQGKLADKRNKHKRRSQKAKTAHLAYTNDQLQARIKLFEDRCLYCQKQLNGSYHIDHYDPLAKGGYDTLDNIVLACPECNASKSDSNMVDWFFRRFGYSDRNFERCEKIIDFVKRINGAS